MSLIVEFFDRGIQVSILNSMLHSDDTCSKMIKYLGVKHKYLKKVSIFEEEELQNIFDVICEAWFNKSVRPPLIEIKQRIHDKYDKIPRERTKQLLDKIYNMEVDTSEFFTNTLQDKIRTIKLFQSNQSFDSIMKKYGHASAAIFKEIQEEIIGIDFSAKKEFNLSDTFTMLDDFEADSSFQITTGDKRLDNILHGGIPRGSLVVLPAGTNTGKSMYCISWAGKVLDQIDPVTGENMNLKVLYIPLEGTLSETNFRFLSNRTKIPLSNVIQRRFDEDDKKSEKIKQEAMEIAKKYDDRLKIVPMMDFKVTIDDLYARLEEIYTDFKFDFLVVDYGQLLKTVVPQEKRHVMGEVYQGLSAAASKFNCVVASPVQATREAQKFQSEEFIKQSGGRLPVVSMEHISEAFEIARVAAYVISLNTSTEEMERNEYRLYLDKSRIGEKGKTFGTIVDFSRCDLHTGNFYDARSGVRDASRISDQLKNEDVSSMVKMNENKDHLKKIIILDEKKSKINDLRKKIVSVEKEIENLKEDNPFDTDENGETSLKMKELRVISDEKEDLETGYMNQFLSIYPEASKSNKDVFQEEYDSKVGKKKYEEECLEIKNILDRYELAIELGLDQ